MVKLYHNLLGSCKIWRAIASLENFLSLPEVPPAVTFHGPKSLHCNFRLPVYNKACIKKSSAYHNFRRGGAFPTPYTLSKHVLQGPSGLSCGPGPLGPSPNSTTGLGELPQQGWTHVVNFGVMHEHCLMLLVLLCATNEFSLCSVFLHYSF